MRYRVYRSLDRPSSIFGIKGKFIIVVGIGAGAGAVVGVLLGTVISSGLVGFIAFLVVTALGFVFTLTLQGRMSVKQLTRFLASRKYPDYIKIRPARLLSETDIIEK